MKKLAIVALAVVALVACKKNDQVKEQCWEVTTQIETATSVMYEWGTETAIKSMIDQQKAAYEKEGQKIEMTAKVVTAESEESCKAKNPQE